MQPIILHLKEQAQPQQTQQYRLGHHKKTLTWPMQCGQRLGTCGMWNFLWRLGFHPLECHLDTLPRNPTGHFIFIDHVTSLDENDIDVLRNWLHLGGRIIATGELCSWEEFLPQSLWWATSDFENPNAALGYMFENHTPELIAPPNWNFISYQADNEKANYVSFGKIIAILGEVQTPHRAVLKKIENAPAIIQSGAFYYLNGHPFSALQSWLQGQENLAPFLAWHHRMFWLDEWISNLYDLLIRYNVLPNTLQISGIKQLPETTVILRHDLDYSKDLTFLKIENEKQIAASHAILKDRNAKFWIDELSKHPHHEIAFHYNTGKRNWRYLINRLVGKKHGMPFLPGQNYIAYGGLLKQIHWAIQQGIEVKTLHRHLCYMIYPEWIDALDRVYDQIPTVLGSSSLFRGHVLRWGQDRVDGTNGYLVDFPDSQFPLSYPYKIAHAGKSGKILKGWEISALMEIEPEMLFKLLEYKIKHIHQRVFSLIFHPAHTKQSSLYPKGSLNNFTKIINHLIETNIKIISMSKLFDIANTCLNNEVKQQRVPHNLKVKP